MFACLSKNVMQRVVRSTWKTRTPQVRDSNDTSWRRSYVYDFTQFAGIVAPPIILWKIAMVAKSELYPISQR